MEKKNFLTSDYYKLTEVHALNTFLKELPKSNMSEEKIKELADLLSLYKSYDNLADYVKNSEKYNEIIEKDKLYSEAQIKLKELNYTKEIILDDFRADLSDLTKHTITYNTTKTHTEWYYDSEIGDEIGNDYEIEVEITEHYYSKSYDCHNSINPINYIRPYTRKTGYNNIEDLIAEQIKSYEYVCSELQAYGLCTDKGYDIKLFKKVFDIDNLKYYGHTNISEIKDMKTDKRYHLRDVEKLMQEVQTATEKRYIFEDKYVKYPYTNYVDFLENYLNKTYFEEDLKP